MSSTELKYTGASQQDRLPEALEPGYFNTEEREIPDFMAYAAEFSKVITYYNLADKKEGNWHPFFSTDKIFRLASLAVTDREEIKKKINRLLAILSDQSMPDPVRYYALRDCYEFCTTLVAMAKSLIADLHAEEDSLMKQEKDADTYADFKKFVLTIMEDLVSASQNLSEVAGRKKNLREGDDPDGAEPLGIQIPEGLLPDDDIAIVMREVQEIINCYVSTVDHAKNSLGKILADKTHQFTPHLGVFVSYLSLLKYPVKNLNNFQERILDYYYETILLEKKKPAKPDSVFVSFIPGAGFNNIFVDKGTRLLAGKDDAGNDILFETSQGTNINTIEIPEIYTLSLPKNKLLYSSYAAPMITGMFLSENKSGLKDEMGWAAFGEDQLGKSVAQRTMKNAEIGFAVSSPLFDLCEGLRKITIEIRFHPETYGKLISLAQSTAAGARKNILSDIQFNSVFSISATTPDAWADLDYSVKIGEALSSKEPVPCSLTFEISIPESFPAIASFNPKIHEGNYPSDFPVIKVLLNQDTSPFAYSILQPLGIKYIDLSCSVKRLRKISVYYQQSKLDNSKPYNPFGPVPAKGRYFLVGHSELFKKKLTSLNFILNWQSIPENGFEAYYKGYPVAITNKSFKTRMKSLSAGKWGPEENAPEFFLFEENEKGELKAATIISVTELDKLNIKTDTSLNGDLVYDLNSKSGFFRFELVEPAFAFGNDLYASALSNAIQENARNEENQQLPNPPFNPLLNEIEVQYEAAETLDLTKKKQGFYHINPFTTYEVNSGQVIASQKVPPPVNAQGILPAITRPYEQLASFSFLFPAYEDQGYLFMGLKNVLPPQSLSLLFRLTSASANVFGISKSPPVKWSYLSEDNWKFFPDDNLPVDGTEQLIKTGIITFNIPQDITSDNVIMPPGLFWIRGSVQPDSATEKYVVSDIVEIIPNSAHCSRILPADTVKTIEPVPPATIKELKVPDPTIKKVIQAQASFGGSGIESKKKYYTRVSERLRHKGRAVNLWDFERLVLEEFPQVFKVICIKGARPENPAAGGIRVIVIPDLEKDSLVTNRLAPRASLSLLEEIRNFVSEIASPFVSPFVSNPNYETIKVNCSVKFSDNSGAEFYATQLNSDLQVFLSPWIKNGLELMKFDAEINMYSVLNFIETRPYVRFVTGFSVVRISSLNEEYSLCDSVTMDKPGELSPVKPSSAWSVLVSAEKHNITILESSEPMNPKAIGLNQMIINDDFIINNTELCL